MQELIRSGLSEKKRERDDAASSLGTVYEKSLKRREKEKNPGSSLKNRQKGEVYTCGSYRKMRARPLGGDPGHQEGMSFTILATVDLKAARGCGGALYRMALQEPRGLD